MGIYAVFRERNGADRVRAYVPFDGGDVSEQ